MLEAFPIIAWGLVFVAGVACYLRLASNPRLFWTIVAAAAVLTSGLIIGSYSAAGQVLITCIILAAPSRRGPVPSAGRAARCHDLAFTALLVYLLIQSVRAVIEFQDPKKLRWVLFYVVLLALARKAVKPLYSPDPMALVSLICKVSTAYFVTYIAYGLFTGYVLGIDRFLLQPGHAAQQLSIWGSTAYVMFPVTILLPAMWLGFKRGEGKISHQAFAALLASVGAAAYSDSRASALSLLAFSVVSMATLGARRFARPALGVIAVLAVFVVFVWPSQGRDFEFFLDDIFRSGASLYAADNSAESQRDLDRSVHMRVAFTVISTDPVHFLFGYGFRASGYVIGPAVVDLYHQRDPSKVFRDIDNMGTETFTDFVVNTGVIGFLLLAITTGSLAVRCATETTCPAVALLSLGLIVGWLFVINLIDVVLLYFALMPGGILLQIGRIRRRPTPLYFPVLTGHTHFALCSRTTSLQQ